MPLRYRRHFLRTREINSILSEASCKLGINLEGIMGNRGEMELVETDSAQIYLISGKPLFARVDGRILPTLVFEELLDSMPKVVVDMGAVPHVCNGANIMAPGIVRFEGEFNQGDLVLVVDEKHGKAVALCESMYDVDTARKLDKGIAFQNIHFVGDELWKLAKRFQK